MNLNLEQILPSSGKGTSCHDFPAMVVAHNLYECHSSTTAYVSINSVAIDWIGNHMNADVASGDKIQLFRGFDDGAWYLSWVSNKEPLKGYSLYGRGSKLFFQSKHHFKKGLQAGVYQLLPPIHDEGTNRLWFPLKHINP